MKSDFLAEEGEYLIICSAESLGKGKWLGSALFEREVDRNKEFVPAVRHRIISTTFDSEDDAAQAAYRHACELIEKGLVGLD